MHLSRLKASALFFFQKNCKLYETQQLILGIGYNHLVDDKALLESHCVNKILRAPIPSSFDINMHMPNPIKTILVHNMFMK